VLITDWNPGAVRINDLGDGVEPAFGTAAPWTFDELYSPNSPHTRSSGALAVRIVAANSLAVAHRQIRAFTICAYVSEVPGDGQYQRCATSTTTLCPPSALFSTNARIGSLARTPSPIVVCPS